MPDLTVNTAQPRLGALWGTGRSGTTWLGSIVNSHPNVAYRFEPFARLKHHPRIAAAIETINHESFSEADLPQIYDALFPAHPGVEKVPFFPKDNARSLGKSAVWAFTRKVPRLAPLMERLYSPSDTPMVVFKEVNLADLTMRFAEHTTVPLIYIVRFPCAYAASVSKGQNQGLLTAGRFKYLGAILRDNAPQLYEQFKDRLDSLSPAARNTLLWRYDLESVWPHLQKPHVMTLIYEDLCVNPMQRAEEIMAFLGLEMTQQTRDFVQLSTSGTGGSTRTDKFVNEYFTVYRDPAESMNRWKKELDQTDRDDIASVLDNCEVYHNLRSRGFWE